MGKAFMLPVDAKCGECGSKINEGDLYTIIYEDDNTGKIRHLLCDECEVDDGIQYYRDTGRVSSHLSMEAALANYHYNESDDPTASLARLRADVRHFFWKYKKELMEIAAGNIEIQEAIREFELKHWLPHIKEYWNKTSRRGHEAKVDEIKLLMWGCAGRVMLTVGTDDENVTMIFSDEESQQTPNGGQQGIDCSQKKAVEILKNITAADKIRFKSSKSVTMAGL